VDGWTALAGRFGARPLGETLETAIGLAREGFEVSDELAGGLKRLEPTIGQRPSAAEFYPEGRPPRIGERIVRRRYADSLQRIASEGRDGFYRGSIARAVVTATGGILGDDDLASNRPDWVEPLGIDVFGMRAWTVPPNSQGYVTLAASWMVERLAPPADPDDPRFHHAVIEAYRAAAWDRDRLAGDPDASGIDPVTLLSPERLAERLGRISPVRAAPWPPAASDPGGTAYLCVVDRAGMGVSLIQSNFTGIGSGIPAGETGIWLHNRGAGFSLRPGDPNEAAPGKRPLHTLAPTLWTSGGDLRMLLGTRGGHQQPQYLTQVVSLLHVAGLDPGSAQASPRWSMDFEGEAGTPGEDAFSGSAVVVEARMPEQIVAGLVGRGHRVSLGPDLPPGWGPVSVITLDAAGTRLAAADPRVSTAAAGTE
jgi:gamma-glutamyltranspeptidase/glutathione hydrolase